MPLLELREVESFYGSVQALKGISLRVDAGEIVTLLGANGAGKSTTLRTISGLVPGARGEILFMDRPITHVAAEAIVRLGIAHVPEGRRIFPDLKRLSTALGWSLSGGQQQMLAVARGLMAAPKLLLLDEPSLGLAPIVVQQLFGVIRRIREGGTTILLVEQNANMALSVADRGYVLETGSLTVQGSPAELLGNEDVRAAYLGGGQRKDGAATAPLAKS